MCCVLLCPTLCDPMDCSPPGLGFPRQENWSGLPFPTPGIFLTQGSNPHLLHCKADSLPLDHQRSPLLLFFSQFFSVPIYSRNTPIVCLGLPGYGKHTGK